MKELIRALAVMAEPPSRETSTLVEALQLGATPSPEEYTELFTFQLLPYASIYVGAEGMLGGEARDRVAGFWRAVGHVPPTEPDHVAVLLALYARLADMEAEGAPGHVREAFFWEHIASWMPVWLAKLADVATGPYAVWADTLRRALVGTARTSIPTVLPLHLRAAPALGDSFESTEALAQALLTPVRSGTIVTRRDLARLADVLQLGLRAGERRYILRALLEQDARRTLGWLARDAALWSTRWTTLESLGEIARFWSTRAAQTARTLTMMTEDQEVVHAGSGR